MKITLFVPYFKPLEADRGRELAMCLEKNRACKEIDHIYLMIDDDAEVDISDGRVTVLKFDHRPTYIDWVRLSYEYCGSNVSVLANADIYFDASVSRFSELFRHDPTGFVALSRYELLGSETTLHPNPHWSQDVWAFLPEKSANPARDNNLNFPLGVPRCDNKVAYVFGVYGHTVYNPCRQIRSVHVHETGIRNYSKKGDRRILGGVAMVHASDGLLDPAQLDIEMWPVKNQQFTAVKLNKTLEKWAVQEGREPQPDVEAPPRRTGKPTQTADTVAEIIRSAKQPARQLQSVADSAASAAPVPPAFNRAGSGKDINHEAYHGVGRIEEPGLLGFDNHWQFPAITERHAFHQMQMFAPRQQNVVYVGFPWATIIDLSNHNKNDRERLDELNAELDYIASLTRQYKRVITVCQHIHMLKFPEFFQRAGITDIFWSHARVGLPNFPAAPDINLHAFPLFPVQEAEGPEVPLDARKHLFSFVGAKANKIYLTESRNMIIEELGNDPRGLVVERETWHYNKVVYDAQILGKSKIDDKLVDNQASDQFKEVMRQTVFALCPSGTGPNSIRLWEAIVSGSIPVVLADTYRTPASDALWSQATISCTEEREAIRALPDRLEAIMANPVELQCRRAALQVLALRYGRRNFVADVLEEYRRQAFSSDAALAQA